MWATSTSTSVRNQPGFRRWPIWRKVTWRSPTTATTAICWPGASTRRRCWPRSSARRPGPTREKEARCTSPRPRTGSPPHLPLPGAARRWLPAPASPSPSRGGTGSQCASSATVPSRRGPSTSRSTSPPWKASPSSTCARTTRSRRSDNAPTSTRRRRWRRPRSPTWRPLSKCRRSPSTVPTPGRCTQRWPRRSSGPVAAADRLSSRH